MTSEQIEGLLRETAPQVLATLVRRYGPFGACEDAVREALLAAAVQWPAEGVPERPGSALLTVGGRALVGAWRADSARRRRETVAALDPAGAPRAAGLAAYPADAGQDDILALLFLCCHPALAPSSQLALTLRAVGGLTTAQIAAACLVPEATIAKRIARAKRRIRDTGARFRAAGPAGAHAAARRGPPRALPHLQRGVHHQLRPGPATAGPDR